MEKILSKKKQEKQPEKQPDLNLERKPWIDRVKGLRVIILVGLALAVLVAYQLIQGGGNWLQGILWGLAFGGSVVLVYFGMNAFHSFINKDKDTNDKQ
jgi:predicted cobalt transporter CbtA